MSIAIELLKKFCSTDTTRLAINSPFSQEQWTYATDGRVIVRVPRLADVPENEKAPKNIDENIWRKNPGLTGWQDLPTYPKPTEVECETCGGGGVHECSCGDSHGCANCDGSGIVPEPVVGVKIGRQHAANNYLHLLSELPSVKISESAVDEHHALHFIFDGGEGLLMPYKTR